MAEYFVDEDYALAVSLQDDILALDNEISTSSSRKRQHPTSIVDDCWETIDPTPDIRELFLQFNDTYFYGKLSCCEVKWAPRMTLCAGVCCYEGRGGLCSVKLSMPLLKLRPRKDLVQTLLHEMIHAYLFVTNNNKDHNAHGPEFHKHMNRINKVTGANITVYHNFHDEVDLYRQHWWRCDGPCQKQPPYYGMVRRAMNRPPSARDPWWGDHQRTCGGIYSKVREPEDYGRKKRKNDKHDDTKNGDDSSTKGMPKLYDLWKKQLGGETSDSNQDEEAETDVSKKQHNKSTNRSGNMPNSNCAIIPFSGKGHVLGTANADCVNKGKNNRGLLKSGDPCRGSFVMTNSKSKLVQSKIDSMSSFKGGNYKRNNGIALSTSKRDGGNTFDIKHNVEVSTDGRDPQSTKFPVENIGKGFTKQDGILQKDKTYPTLTHSVIDLVHTDGLYEGEVEYNNVSISDDWKTKDPKQNLNSETELTTRKNPDERPPLIVLNGTPPIHKPLTADKVKFVPCPVCLMHVDEMKINTHLDICLS